MSGKGRFHRGASTAFANATTITTVSSSLDSVSSSLDSNVSSPWTVLTGQWSQNNASSAVCESFVLTKLATQ